MNGEGAPEYVKLTEYVEEAIGNGKVALRIHNISILDDGFYQCLFNHSGFSDMAFLKLSVASKLLVGHNIPVSLCPTN